MISSTFPLTRSQPLTLTAYWPPGHGSSTASMPIHRTIFAGSVRNSNTTDGGASILISRSTSSALVLASLIPAPVVGFDLALEDLEVLAPEVVQERAQLGQTLGPRSIDASGAVSALTHEAGIAQVPQVLGDGLAGDVEVRRDLNRRPRPGADDTQAPGAPRLGD